METSQEGGSWCLMLPTPPGTPMWNILPTRIDRQPLFLNICGSVTAIGVLLPKVHVGVGDHSGGVGTQAGQQGGTAGPAERKLAVGVVEAHSAGGQPIDVRGPDDRMPVAAERRGQVVGRHKEDIGRPLGTRAPEGACGYQRREFAARGQGRHASIISRPRTRFQD